MAFKDKDKANRYVNNHKKEHYDRITILRKKGEKDILEKVASANGYRGLSTFINYCVDRELNQLGIVLNDGVKTDD